MVVARQSRNSAPVWQSGVLRRCQPSRPTRVANLADQRRSIEQILEGLVWNHPTGLDLPAIVPCLPQPRQRVPFRPKQAETPAFGEKPDQLRGRHKNVDRQVAPEQTRRHVLYERPLQIAIAEVHRKRAVDGRLTPIRRGGRPRPAHTNSPVRATAVEIQGPRLRRSKNTARQILRPAANRRGDRAPPRRTQQRSAAGSAHRALARSVVDVHAATRCR